MTGEEEKVVEGACDHACLFCASDGQAPEPNAWPTSGPVTFVGMEPGAGDLETHVAEARSRGLSPIGVQTHGAHLGRARIEALASLGLTEIELSLQGPTAPLQDYLVGQPGSFERALEVLGGARALGIEVRVTTVLTRSSFRSLAPMGPLLAGYGVTAWRIIVPEVAGRAADAFDRVVPRLALALPYALHALAEARNSGLEAVLSGAPSCLLGPHAAFVSPSPSRSHGAPCQGCAARSSCPGLAAIYLARFGDGELRRLEVAVPAHLAPRFAGSGPLAARGLEASLARDAGQRHLRVL